MTAGRRQFVRCSRGAGDRIAAHPRLSYSVIYVLIEGLRERNASSLFLSSAAPKPRVMQPNAYLNEERERDRGCVAGAEKMDVISAMVSTQFR